MKQFNTQRLYAERVDLPPEIKQALEDELESYGLPCPSNYLVFKRKNYFRPVLETVHVDYSSELIHSSIVLPIENCEGTKMFWMSGDYSLETRILPHGDPYQMVFWKSKAEIIEQQEITEPTLCRVDIPHDALSNEDGSYRTILSIRLKGNPTFKEVMEQRFTYRVV